MTTADELRDKVHRAIFFGDAKTTEGRANAAIRLVLEEAANLAATRSAMWEQHSSERFFEAACIEDEIRALMPEDPK